MPAPTSLVCSCLPSVHGSGGGVLRCSGVRLSSSGSRSTGRPSSALRFFSSSSSCRRFLREEAEAPQNENPAAGGGEVSGRAALGLGGAASSRSGVFLKGLARSVAVALVTRLTWALVCCRFLYCQRVQAPVKAWHCSLQIPQCPSPLARPHTCTHSWMLGEMRDVSSTPLMPAKATGIIQELQGRVDGKVRL